METANKCNNKHILYIYDLGDESQVHSRDLQEHPDFRLEHRTKPGPLSQLSLIQKEMFRFFSNS